MSKLPVEITQLATMSSMNHILSDELGMLEWFANIWNQKTLKAYRFDVTQFSKSVDRKTY